MSRERIVEEERRVGGEEGEGEGEGGEGKGRRYLPHANLCMASMSD